MRLVSLCSCFVKSIEARCKVENEDVVGVAPTGDAPTTSEWSTISLPLSATYIRDLTVCINQWCYVIIIIKWEESTLPIVSYFFRCCVPEMFVISYSATYCIYIAGTGILFSITIGQFMMNTNIPLPFRLAYPVRLNVHYTISLSSLCKLIWRHWINKMPVRYILSSVWVRLSIWSIIQYIGLCYLFHFTHYPCDDWETIYFVLSSSSNRKYELTSIV